jgi:transmembrane sensor
MTFDSDDDRSGLPSSDSASSLSDQAVEWFARLRSEDCSAEERLAFHAWRNRTPSHHAAYEEVVALWNDPALRSAATEAAGASIPFESHRPDGRRFPSWFRRTAIAAMIAGLVVLTGLQLDLPVRFLADHSTSTGEQRMVQLSDRSRVTLNAQSAIDEAFDASTRRVRLLKGEAFFQVTHDQHKPFLVEGGAVIARAVGTAFVVRQESDGIRVTVAEGIVELAPLQPAWPAMRLTAGQQVSVATDRAGLVREVDVKQATAWLRGRLVVEDARLGDVIEGLRPYHPGMIHVWDRSLNEIRVNGSYNLADPMAVLLALTETLPVRMATVTDRIVVLFSPQ